MPNGFNKKIRVWSLRALRPALHKLREANPNFGYSIKSMMLPRIRGDLRPIAMTEPEYSKSLLYLESINQVDLGAPEKLFNATNGKVKRMKSKRQPLKSIHNLAAFAGSYL